MSDKKQFRLAGKFTVETVITDLCKPFQREEDRMRATRSATATDSQMFARW